MARKRRFGSPSVDISSRTPRSTQTGIAGTPRKSELERVGRSQFGAGELRTTKEEKAKSPKGVRKQFRKATKSLKRRQKSS